MSPLRIGVEFPLSYVEHNRLSLLTEPTICKSWKPATVLKELVFLL